MPEEVIYGIRFCASTKNSKVFVIFFTLVFTTNFNTCEIKSMIYDIYSTLSSKYEYQYEGLADVIQNKWVRITPEELKDIIDPDTEFVHGTIRV
jgi:hypothetical protein